MTDELRETQATAIRLYITAHGFKSTMNVGTAMGLEWDDWRQYANGHRILTMYHLARLHAVCAIPNDTEDLTEFYRREHDAFMDLVNTIAFVQYENAKLEPSRRAMWSRMPAPSQRD